MLSALLQTLFATFVAAVKETAPATAPAVNALSDDPGFSVTVIQLKDGKVVELTFDELSLQLKDTNVVTLDVHGVLDYFLNFLPHMAFAIFTAAGFYPVALSWVGTGEKSKAMDTMRNAVLAGAYGEFPVVVVRSTAPKRGETLEFTVRSMTKAFMVYVLGTVCHVDDGADHLDGMRALCTAKVLPKMTLCPFDTKVTLRGQTATKEDSAKKVWTEWVLEPLLGKAAPKTFAPRVHTKRTAKKLEGHTRRDPKQSSHGDADGAGAAGAGGSTS